MAKKQEMGAATEFLRPGPLQPAATGHALNLNSLLANDSRGGLEGGKRTGGSCCALDI